MKRILLVAVAVLMCIFLKAAEVPITKGMRITKTTTIAKGNYTIQSDSGFQQPLIIISGRNITVDFNNAVLKGAPENVLPNRFTGIAVLITKGSSGITILNANIKGFKIALMADSVSKLTIEHCDFSYNYRQHLHSNWKREDISDWMSYHHNENKEWMRYGAGIYLQDCSNSNIHDNTITNGQCGLMMTRCNNINAYDNNFSFNSGLGIGLYRSNNNKIYHNKLDFNIRGFSFGKYYRGQDSAGILVFEQCNNNVFAYNSVTNSGDGFFLWAGQHTMDSGEGGCNDNLLYKNDFSYAPTNGVELTFSRNSVINNIIHECDNGVWGGYSYHTDITGNDFGKNNTAIAIEHGQFNEIIGNNFNGDKTAIKLWSRATQPPDWIYAQKRDTRSMQYDIIANSFKNTGTVYNIMGTDNIRLIGDQKSGAENIYKFGLRMGYVDSAQENSLADVTGEKDKRLATIPESNIPPNRFPHEKADMRITEWGPYNFDYPCIFLDSVSKEGLYSFKILKAKGDCVFKAANGFKILQNNGDVIIAKADSSIQNRFIEYVYKGPDFIDELGKIVNASKSYTVKFSEFDAGNVWHVNFYSWKQSPDNLQQFEASLTNRVLSEQTHSIDYTWWGALGKELPADSFATIATTTMDLPEADYNISITADDMAKLFIDGRPVIDAWNRSYVDLDENTNHAITLHLKGKHSFKIVHAEIGGLADLAFYIKPVAL